MSQEEGDIVKDADLIEEIKEAGEKLTKDVEVDVKTSEYTEFEQEQMKLGWKPDGEKSAEEWSRSKPLYDEIKNRGKQLAQMQKAIDQLTEHMKKTEDAAYKKALAKLNKEKQEAIERGDVEGVMEVEKKFNETQKALEQQAPPPEVEQFWNKYEKLFSSADYEEMEIAAFIRQRDNELAVRNMSPGDHMKVLEEHMLKKFPNYFNAGKEVIDRDDSGVESIDNSRKMNRKGKLTFKDLTDSEKEVARNFEKCGIMKIEDYISEVQKLRAAE